MVTLPDRADGISRAFALAEAQSIPSRLIGGLFYGVQEDILEPALLVRGLNALLKYPENEKQAALEAALNLADTWFAAKIKAKHPIPSREDGVFWAPIIELIERFDSSKMMERYFWANICKHLIEVAPRLVVRKSCDALAEDLYTGRHGESILREYAKVDPVMVMDEVGSAMINPATAVKLSVRGIGGLLFALPLETIFQWIDKDPKTRSILCASSLPRPYLEGEKAVVPEITERFLDKYGSDESVARKFIVGSGIRSYSGDIAGAHRKEAEVARQFRSHRIAAIRNWAEVEEQRANYSADRWQQITEEEMVIDADDV